MLTFPLKLTMVNREFAKQETEPRNQTNQEPRNQTNPKLQHKYPTNPKTESQIQTKEEEPPCHPLTNQNNFKIQINQRPTIM